MIMPFGKHKDQDVSDLPLPYLKWVEENCKDISKELRDAVNYEIGIRTGDMTSFGRTISPVEQNMNASKTSKLYCPSCNEFKHVQFPIRRSDPFTCIVCNAKFMLSDSNKALGDHLIK